MPTPPTPPPVPLSSRRIAGRYRLLEVGGRGGMALVWRALQSGAGHFERPVAVKQMHPHLASSPMYREMFCEEARVAAALSDGNIPQIYDFLEEDEQLYLVMEWVDGISLSTYIRFIRERRGVPSRWDLVTAIGIGMLRGLSAAHERVEADGTPAPVVHRDVSPHNVLISANGKAKIIDFGLSLALDRTSESTPTGVAKGKLAYLSPEIVDGQTATALTDQFAVGSVLWEALTGKRAFEEDAPLDTFRRVSQADLPRVEELRFDVPGALAEIVHKALAKDPADRFKSAREMARQLGRVLSASRAAEDLYHSLSRDVKDARVELGLGQRTQDPTMLEETPLPEELSDFASLVMEDEAAVEEAQRSGWMPAFLRKLTER